MKEIVEVKYVMDTIVTIISLAVQSNKFRKFQFFVLLSFKRQLLIS